MVYKILKNANCLLMSLLWRRQDATLKLIVNYEKNILHFTYPIPYIMITVVLHCNKYLNIAEIN